MKKLSRLNAAYLSGIIDGEGHIFVNRVNTGFSSKSCKRGYLYRSGIAVAMVDIRTLIWIKRITGIGQIRKCSKPDINSRQAWRWAVWSNEASKILKVLLPYLKLKRPNAINQISFQAKMKRSGYAGVTDAEWNRREKHRQKSFKLNKRGL